MSGASVTITIFCDADGRRQGRRPHPAGRREIDLAAFLPTVAGQWTPQPVRDNRRRATGPARWRTVPGVPGELEADATLIEAVLHGDRRVWPGEPGFANHFAAVLVPAGTARLVPRVEADDSDGWRVDYIFRCPSCDRPFTVRRGRMWRVLDQLRGADVHRLSLHALRGVLG